LPDRRLVFGKSEIALEQSSPSIFVDTKRLIPCNRAMVLSLEVSEALQALYQLPFSKAKSFWALPAARFARIMQPS
jgi:hypothetical protein